MITWHGNLLMIYCWVGKAGCLIVGTVRLYVFAGKPLGYTCRELSPSYSRETDKFEHVFSCFSIGWGFLQSRFTWYSSFWFTTQLLIQSLLSFASTEALEVDPGNPEGGLAKVLGIKYACLCMTNCYWCLSVGEETDGSFIFLIYL